MNVDKKEKKENLIFNQQFAMQKKIGSGSFGAVFIAFDINTA